MFQLGEEWDNALRLILRFIKAKLPPTSVSSAPGKERKQESEEKLIGNAGTRSTRARHTTASGEGGSTLTRAGKAKVPPHCLLEINTHTLNSTTHTREHVLM